MLTAGDAPIEAAEFERRIALLSELHALAALPVESLAPLVAGLREERYAPGSIVSEAAASARRFVIVAGQAEVAAPGASGPVPLATLGPGELFGEAALLEPEGDRHAIITAQSELHVLSFDGAVFEQLVADDPMAQVAFGWIADNRMTARFLKLASPFAALTPD
jgi:CRP-like cAMP-binding protein